MISANLSAIFYLISGVLFILALRGLSSPETSRKGNFLELLGMIIAITVTFLSIGNFSTGFIFVLIFLLIGGLIGAFIAYKIPMTAMPELVAGFHSLVGLAAVFVAISAFLNPVHLILGFPGDIKLASLIEMSIGAAVGAITFSGSIIAFLKLQGIMSGAPITFKGQHPLNAFNINFYSCFDLFIMLNTIIKFILDINWCFIFNWFFINNSNWRCRYASCYFYAKFLFGLGSCWYWVYLGKYCFNNHRCFVGSSGAILIIHNV